MSLTLSSYGEQLASPAVLGLGAALKAPVSYNSTQQMKALVEGLLIKACQAAIKCDL